MNTVYQWYSRTIVPPRLRAPEIQNNYKITIRKPSCE